MKSAVDKANEEELRESMLKYKKLRTRNIVEDKYGQKKYVSELSLHQTRTIFKHRTSMTQFVKLNYKGMKSYQKDGWKCEDCSCLDSEDHLLWCEGYEDMRDGLDLEDEKQLSVYLHRIHLKRSKREKRKI